MPSKKTTPTALVASAKRVQGAGDPTRTASTGNGWQEAAWHFYDTVGEYAYAVNWVGNLLSRAKLFATRDDGSGPVRLPDTDPAAEYVNSLFGNTQGRSQALQQIGVHYTVAGETWIIGRQDGGMDSWQVAAPSRIERQGDTWLLDRVALPTNAFKMRIWRPHPINPRAATSPSRAALPILSEIERLTMHVAAQVDSRLASAGVLLMPNSMTFNTAVDQDASGSATSSGSSDAFVKVLQDVMARAIANRDDASALVPIVVTGDADAIDKVQHITFWSELDNQAIELRTEAIRRLALSMDMPPEILTGQSEGSRFHVWSIDESAIKSHTEPLLNRIAADLAQGYLRPLLTDDGHDPEEVEQYGIGIDTAEMRLRPNRSREALELYDRGELKPGVLLEETGFDPDTDAPTAREMVMWLTQKVAQGQTTPEIVEAALRLLGVQIEAEMAQEAQETQEERPTPSLEEHPDRDMPEPSDGLVAACEVLVFRALERAGNRLRNKMQRKIPNVAAPETYMFVPCDKSTLDFALDDAWTAVDRFATRWGVNAERLKDCLDAYARAIMGEQKPHDPELMKQFIALLEVTA